MLGDTVNKETSFNTNWATHTTSAYIQCFCLYLNQQTAASNAWTFCVCTWRTHTHTTNTLSYSFSHSVELPLCFTGVVLHHLRETVTFTQNNLDTVRRTFQFIGANAVPAHYLLSFWCSRTFFYFVVHLLLSKAAYVYDYVYNSNTCLSPFTKGMVNYFLKKLPVPKNNRAAPRLVSRVQPLDMLASCLTSLTAYEGNFRYLGLYCRVQSIVCNLVRFW